MLPVFGQKFGFHLHLYLLLSPSSCVGQGLAFSAHCTLAFESSQSIEFWSVSECEWIQSRRFLLSKVQVQAQGLYGGAWWSELHYQSIRVSWPDGSVAEPGNIVPGFPCTIIIPAPILLLPSSGQKLISRRWESLTTKYSNWNWNNKQTRIGETGSTMCTVIYQAGVRESCVLSLDSVRCIHIHKNSLSI